MENPKEYAKLVIDDVSYETRLTSKFRRRKPWVAIDPKKIYALIPGIITKLNVYEGQKIIRGQSLLILEAMKMMNDLTCPLDGRIKTIHIKQSQMVVKGQLLIELE